MTDEMKGILPPVAWLTRARLAGSTDHAAADGVDAFFDVVLAALDVEDAGGIVVAIDFLDDGAWLAQSEITTLFRPGGELIITGYSGSRDPHTTPCLLANPPLPANLVGVNPVQTNAVVVLTPPEARRTDEARMVILAGAPLDRRLFFPDHLLTGSGRCRLTPS